MGNLLFIPFLIVVGFLLQRVNLSEDFGKSLNQFIIYISLPAMVLLKIPEATIGAQTLLLALTPWVLLIPMVILALLLTRGLSFEYRASLLLLLPLGNTSFVGIPMLQALIGDEAIPYALVYDQFGSFLMLAIYGGFVVAYFEHGVIDLKKIIKKIVLFPPFLALIFALIFKKMPDFTTPYLEILSNTLVPLALISVGFALKIRVDEHKALFIQALFIKLLLTPLIVYIILQFFEVDALVLKVAILESAMPIMITAGALAISSNFAPKFSATLLGYSILLSLFTVPLISYLLNF